MSRELLSAIRSRQVRIGVIGLGYAGLPVADSFAAKGFRVTGFDTDRKKVDALNRGRCHILSVPESRLKRHLRQKRFRATTDLREARNVDVILICVPTPLAVDRQPDLRYVRQTGEKLSRSLRPGQLVVLESTTYPGTTREVLLPALERSGLHIGGDVLLAYSPERIDPGNARFHAGNIPKVVGGIDSGSLTVAAALYRQVVPRVVRVSSCEVAEACKLVENIYRSVNIAMVNELKMLFDRLKIDIFEVIRAAATKPFGYQPFFPGPGWGGHCIPVDPYYLSWKARRVEFETRFIELAAEINRRMPFYVVGRLEEALGRPLKGMKILVLGVAYKKDIDDPRESPAFPILELLAEKGARVGYHDPYIPRLPRMCGFRTPSLRSRALTPSLLASHDAVVIVTDHSRIDYAQVVRHAKLVVDTRNVTEGVPGRGAKVVRA